MDLLERVRRKAVTYFESEGQHGWPTVAEVARSLKVRQGDVQEAIESTDCDIDLTGFDLDDPLGKRYVEVYGHDPK